MNLRLKRLFSIAIFLVSVSVQGQSSNPAPAMVDTPKETKSVGAWDWWSNRFRAELDYLDRIDYWGNATSQLPKGLLGLKYHCNFVKGGEQWDMKGNSMGGVLPVIDGDFGDSGAIRLDPRATGGAVFHEIQEDLGISFRGSCIVGCMFLLASQERRTQTSQYRNTGEYSHGGIGLLDLYILFQIRLVCDIN